MKINDKIPHGKIGHFCNGGCTGYAKGGMILPSNPQPEEKIEIIPERTQGVEQPMDQDARVKKELGIAPRSGTDSLVSLIPGLGLMSQIGKATELQDALNNPELLASKYGPGWNLGTNNRRNSTAFDHEADVQMLSEGGVVEDKRDPSEIPEDIKLFVEKVHKDMKESRPDEEWKMGAASQDAKPKAYKKDEEETEREQHFDDGGIVGDDFSVNTGDTDTAKLNGVNPSPNLPTEDTSNWMAGAADKAAPPVESPLPVNNAPVATPALPSNPDNSSPMMGNTSPVKNPSTMMPDLSDQDFMNKASNMLGLSPDNQASFLKLLGDKAQEGQIGAGIAGIGDAIASGGTLGKVNPGGLKNAEELIQNKEKQGVEGTQMLRENAVQNFELGQKLKANAPYSPEMQKALVEEFHVPAALANAPRSTLEQLLPEATKIEVANRELEFNKAKMTYEGQAGASDKAASIAQPYDEKINTINNLLATIQAGKSPDTKALQSAGINTHWYTANDSPGTMKALTTIKQQLVAQRNDAIQKMTAANPLSGNVSEQYKSDKAKPTPQDMAAYQHAKANPNDPKSKQILAILQKKGLI